MSAINSLSCLKSFSSVGDNLDTHKPLDLSTGRLYAQTLDQETPLFQEVQHVLTTGYGIRTLSNGLKIHLFPEGLKGGMYQQAERRNRRLSITDLKERFRTAIENKKLEPAERFLSHLETKAKKIEYKEHIEEWELESLRNQLLELKKSEVVSQVPKTQQLKTTPFNTTETQSVSQTIPEIAFGKAKWQKYFGDIGTEPPLPSNIDQILKSYCPFWWDKRVEETHLLILIPSTINGIAFNLNTLQELIQNPKMGYKTNYRCYYEDTQKEIGSKSPKSSYWALITKNVLPDSRNKNYSEQKSLIKSPYAVPGALEIATGILIYHAQTGERLYSDNPDNYTRCQENLEVGSGYRVWVGGFSSSGLYLSIGSHGDDYRGALHGLGSVRYV